MPAPPGANTKWIEGLRGMASLLVLTAHITRCLAPWVLSPSLGKDGPPAWIHLPIIRAFTVGRPSVAIFALVSGFVNSLKPIRQTRAGQVDVTLQQIAKAAYRRTGRFIIPAMFATTIAWLLAQTNAYYISRFCDSQWMRDTSPKPSSGLFMAFRDLAANLITTWTSGYNDYEKVQWTLTFLLRGSMFNYLTLFATASMKPNYRYYVYFLLYFFYYCMGDAAFNINMYFGMFMAELNFTPEVQHWTEQRPITMWISSTFLILLGFMCNSFPEIHDDWAGWSRTMVKIGHKIFPKGAEQARFYPGIGSEMVCLGIMFNSTAKRFLTNPWLGWFGKVSWPVYLIHGTLIRVVLSPVLFGMSTRPPWPGNDQSGKPLPQPWRPLYSKWNIVVAVPLFYLLVYRCAMLWAAYVDPVCGKITNWVEYKIFKPEEGAEKSSQPA